MSSGARRRSVPDGIGSRIQQERIERGMEQAELAKQVGVSEKSVSLWERGINSPNWPHIKRLAELFEVHPGWLVSGDPPAREHDEAVRLLGDLVTVARRTHREIVLLRAEVLRPPGDAL